MIHRPIATTGSEREWKSTADAVQQLRERVAAMKRRLRDTPLAPDVYATAKVAESALGGEGVDGRGALKSGLDVRGLASADDTIFVSVAAFRDIECGPTLDDMYRQAVHPRRIFVGIVDQGPAGEYWCELSADCIAADGTIASSPQSPAATTTAAEANASSAHVPPPLRRAAAGGDDVFCPTDNVRRRRLLPHEARGPTYGRYVGMLMYQGERYFMMIDSHNRFAPRWDALLLGMVAQLPDPARGVISHYPSAYEPNKTVPGAPNGYMMFMCAAHFYEGGDGVLRNGAKNIANRQRRPLLHPFTAAGFLFGDAQFVADVPFDPYLDYLFDGEEILYTVRLWTNGWDAFLPSQDIMYHFYGRPSAPKVWNVGGSQWPTIQRRSQQRVRHLLRIPVPNTTMDNLQVPFERLEPEISKELELYGLGTKRKLEDFWTFAHVDVLKRQSDRGFCDSAN